MHIYLIQILANRDLTSDIGTGMDIPYANATYALNAFRVIGGGTAFPTALVAGAAIAGRGRFSTQVFERYQRSENTFVTALTEMFILGVSTRIVTRITEDLCGYEVSTATISTLNRKLER